jgi:enolase
MNDYNFSLEDFNTATKNLVTLIKSVPIDALTFRPFDDAWTISENVVHIVDSEINNYLRLKTILAESGKTTFVSDEEKWAKLIDSNTTDLTVHTELLQLIRTLESNILTAIDFTLYGENYIVHPAAGNIDLKRWLKWYTSGHFTFHVELIERNLELWEKQK